jgi:hypothetical protein
VRLFAHRQGIMPKTKYGFDTTVKVNRSLGTQIEQAGSYADVQITAGSPHRPTHPVHFEMTERTLREHQREGWAPLSQE